MTDLENMPRPRGRPRKSVFQAADGSLSEPAVDSDSEWSEMDSAPHDGRFVRLASGDQAVIGRWKTTRQFHGGRWQTDGKWVDELGRKVMFHPEAWATK